MFFKKKNEDLLKNLDERLKTLEHGVDAGRGRLENLNTSIGKLQAAANKHGMAIEDLLEEWEERQSDEEEVREHFRDFKQGERHLLELFEAYQEQFWSLKRFADSRDETWASQIALMESNLERYRQLCGIVVIGGGNMRVDYDLHEVVETVQTDDLDLDKRIADVYCCGYIYKGNVKKKARVAAYRLGTL